MPAEDLITLAEAKSFLHLVTTADDGKVPPLITAASRWVEQLCDRQLARRPVTNQRLRSIDSEFLELPIWPVDITATFTCTLDGLAVTVWRAHADGDPATYDAMVEPGSRAVLRKARGTWRGSSAFPILVTYTGGYSPIPADLKAACQYLTQKLWRDQEHQRTGITSINASSGGGVGYGGTPLMPDPTIPGEVLKLLAPYRRWSVALA
jgi:hypothetical protein